MIIIGGILVIFICIIRLASKEIFLPSNKIHREVGRAKFLSAPWYRSTLEEEVKTAGEETPVCGAGVVVSCALKC